MDELHRSGGVPRGWRMSIPSGDVGAGRKAFVDFGCPSCHAVQGDNVPAAGAESKGAGPDLTGMGNHHPAEYFAESILDPNAVLVEGPGFIGPDGRSVMPSYGDMTLSQLADLVAYLSSLTGGSSQHCHPAGSAGGRLTFLVQAYEVPPERLDSYYDWFDRQAFRDFNGLVSVQTLVGRNGDRNIVVGIFGFENEDALGRFVEDTARRPVGEFSHPVDRYLLRSPPVYKALGLSAP